MYFWLTFVLRSKSKRKFKSIEKETNSMETHSYGDHCYNKRSAITKHMNGISNNGHRMKNITTNKFNKEKAYCKK